MFVRHVTVNEFMVTGLMAKCEQEYLNVAWSQWPFIYLNYTFMLFQSKQRYKMSNSIIYLYLCDS